MTDSSSSQPLVNAARLWPTRTTTSHTNREIDGTPWNRGMRRVLVGGALVVAGVLVAAACSDDDSATSDPSDVVDAYFAAFNAGDANAVLALLTPDATLTTEDLDWEQELAWNTAQGTVLTAPSCTVVNDQPAEGTTLSCEYGSLDAPTQAADAPPHPVTTRFTVTSLGVSEIHHTYGRDDNPIDLLHVGEPFRMWLNAKHPDVQCLAVSTQNLGCEEGLGSGFSSVEAATENGLMVAQYAQEWGTYLDDNGCTYLDGC